MKFEVDKYAYIGCIPVEDHPNHPEDQSPCSIEVCPNCHKDIWVSEKMRAFMDAKPDVIRVYCIPCLVLASMESGHEPECCDINKIN